MVFRRLLFTFLLCAAPAFAQNVRVDNTAFTTAGLNAAFIANATVTVCTSAGSGLPCTPKVSGLCVSATDATCSSPNPTTSDAFGNYGFWIQPGTYVISVTKAGLVGYSTTLTLPCQPASTCAVTGPQTVGKWNGNCIVDGVQNATLAAAVTCAGTSGVIEIPMFAVPTLTANVTIPAGVTLRFDGPSGITTTGFTLTINGPIVAPPTQIFFGTGTVALGQAAMPAYANWFPGSDCGAQANNGYAVLPSTGGGLIQVGSCTYSTGINFNVANKTLNFRCIPSNVTFGTGGATVLTFTPTSGNAITLADGTGGGIEGCIFRGPGSGTGYGIFESLTVKQTFRDIEVSGFNVNLGFSGTANSSYLNDYYNVQLINAVSNNILWPAAAVGTENQNFFGGAIHQQTSAFLTNCVDVGTGADFHFFGVSFDQCGVTLRNTNPSVIIHGGHLENPGGATSSPFVTCDTSTSGGVFQTVGVKWTSDSGSPSALIQANGSAGCTITSEGDLTQSAVNPLPAFMALGGSNSLGMVINQLAITTTTSYCSGGLGCYVQNPTAGSVTVLGVTIASYSSSGYTFSGIPKVVASGTATMTTAAIAAISGSTVTCGSTVTVSASGVLTTDTIIPTPNAAESSPNTGLRLSFWPTANNVNFAWCNPTASSQTPLAETINWRVTR